MIKVAKFGGSSLATAENIKRAAEIVLSDVDRKYIVVSAPGKWREQDTKVTDMLYSAYNSNSENEIDRVIERFESIANKLNVDFDAEKIFKKIPLYLGVDYFVSRGEYACGVLFAEYLGYEFVDAAEVIFFNNLGALDSEKTNNVLKKRLERCKNAVIPGFYGCMPGNTIKTFSRGGSDITGAVVAKAASADIYENWTDVDGFMLADPKTVGNARTVKYVSYSQLRDLSKMGANVMHTDAVAPVCLSGIPVNIRNTFSSEKTGTIIEHSDSRCSDVTGITGKRGYCTFVIDIAKTDIFRVLSVFDDFRIHIEQLQLCGGVALITVEAEAIKSNRRQILLSVCSVGAGAYIIDDVSILFVSAKHLKTGMSVLIKALSGLEKNNILLQGGVVNSVEGGLTILIPGDKIESAIIAIYNTLIVK